MGSTVSENQDKGANILRWWLTLIIFLLLCATLGFTLWTLYYPPIERKETITSLQTEKSLDIQKYMNEAASPCESFYTFACGNWSTHHPANSQEKQTRAFDVVTKEFDRKLYELLHSQMNGNDSESEKKVKDFYISCINTSPSGDSFYMKDKFKEIAKEIDDMLWNEGEGYDWIELVAQISYRYGINLIMGYSIKPDAKNHTIHNLLLTNPRLTPHFREFQNDCQMMMIEFLDISPNVAKDLAENIGDFEADLWNASRYNLKNPQRINLQNEHEEFLGILNIGKFLKIAFDDVSTPITTLWIENPGYMENLVQLIDSTPKEIVMNYIKIRLLHQFWTEVWRHGQPGHWKSCLKATKHYFPEILSSMFYGHYRLEGKKTSVENLWKYLKSTLRGMLSSNHHLTWFDGISRKYALEKLDFMKLYVASYEDNSFNKDYEILKINRWDFIENLKSIKSFKAMKKRASLYKHSDDSDIALFLESPVYMISSNTIVLPVSVLASDFLWSPSKANAINFGRLGFCLAHEMLHGFSGSGWNYNKFGNYFKWSHPITDYEYAERRKCFRQQYNKYMYGGFRLPRRNQQDENLADNAGIVLAYEAYRKWHNDNKDSTDDQLLLVPLNYTQSQLFFIGYSQLWCADTLDMERQRIATMHIHAPSEMRAFVPLTNFEEFSKEFQCPMGSFMNPINKCKFFN
ncbi:neprilysin-21-like [Haematobia irritans]|uniref:neprilysin-21-like n=1 Tax=Haematobia irritans TaxID=7368 RepID=UPI003F4F70D7